MHSHLARSAASSDDEAWRRERLAKPALRVVRERPAARRRPPLPESRSAAFGSARHEGEGAAAAGGVARGASGQGREQPSCCTGIEPTFTMITEGYRQSGGLPPPRRASREERGGAKKPSGHSARLRPVPLRRRAAADGEGGGAQRPPRGSRSATKNSMAGRPAERGGSPLMGERADSASSSDASGESGRQKPATVEGGCALAHVVPLTRIVQFVFDM